MPAFAQFLLNLRSALSRDSFSFTITFDMLKPKPPFGCKLNVKYSTENLFVKEILQFFVTTEKIILNAKGSESLRTHYFFT